MIAISDQILEMDPHHSKALWFRGKAEAEDDDMESAIKTMAHLCQLEPQNAEFRRELERIKKKKLQQQQANSQVYSKMFQ